jgi:hypothetical protein
MLPWLFSSNPREQICSAFWRGNNFEKENKVNTLIRIADGLMTIFLIVTSIVALIGLVVFFLSLLITHPLIITFCVVLLVAYFIGEQ